MVPSSLAELSRSKPNWLSRLHELESDSDEELIQKQEETPLKTMPLLVTEEKPEQLREWNQKGIPKVLPYNKTSTKWNTPQTNDTWTSIIKTTITPPHELAVEEITYTETIDPVSLWSARVMSAFEKAAATPKKSELSEDFKENLGKLSFFRRPLIPKQ